jgi:hypothetical protein
LPDFALEHELSQLAAESIGWQPLGQGAYLHISNAEALLKAGSAEEPVVITVTGIPDANMAGMNVLLLGW